MLMQNLGEQTNSIMVFSEMAYSMEHTAVYTDSGPRSPKTKYHNQKHLRLTYNETHLTVAMQPTNFHIWQLRAKTSTQQPMQRCSNYNRSNFARRRDCQSNSHTLVGGWFAKKNFVGVPQTGASYCKSGQKMLWIALQFWRFVQNV